MKVLHLSSEKTWRGGERQIAFLIDELEKLGVDNHLACRKDSAFENYAIENKLKHISLPFKSEIDLKTAIGIKKYANKNNIDIIHMHSSKSHGLAVLASTFGAKAKLVLSRRVDFPIKDKAFARWKYNHKSIKRILCVSDAIRNIIRKDIQNPSICRTVHSGVDISIFKNAENKNILREKYNIPKDTLIIANTSALAPHKDYPTFLRTAQSIINKGINAKFLIIGEGNLKEDILSQMKEMNLEDHIIMTGFLDNIPEILPELDIFLITSETEGLGTSIIDAFACKIPVIATAAGGIPELVIDNKTGLLAEVKDHEKLAKNIFKLLNDKELENKLIENAYQHLQGFTKEATAKKTYKEYLEILR